MMGSEIINKGMIDLARDRSLSLAEETQVNGVVVLIWHSGNQIAIGHSIDCLKESEYLEVAGILRDALSVVEAKHGN